MRFIPLEMGIEVDPLAFCTQCACAIFDDDEGANRRQHEEFHEAIAERLDKLAKDIYRVSTESHPDFKGW